MRSQAGTSRVSRRRSAKLSLGSMCSSFEVRVRKAGFSRRQEHMTGATLSHGALVQPLVALRVEWDGEALARAALGVRPEREPALGVGRDAREGRGEGVGALVVDDSRVAVADELGE